MTGGNWDDWVVGGVRLASRRYWRATFQAAMMLGLTVVAIVLAYVVLRRTEQARRRSVVLPGV